MNRLTFVAVAAALTIAGCSKPAARADASRPERLVDATARCGHGGMDAANDPVCRKVRDENFAKFMHKDPGK